MYCKPTIICTLFKCPYLHSLSATSFRDMLVEWQEGQPARKNFLFKTPWDIVMTVFISELCAAQRTLWIWRVSATLVRMLSLSMTGDWESREQLAVPGWLGKWPLKCYACVFPYWMVFYNLIMLSLWLYQKKDILLVKGILKKLAFWRPCHTQSNSRKIGQLHKSCSSRVRRSLLINY